MKKILVLAAMVAAMMVGTTDASLVTYNWNFGTTTAQATSSSSTGTLNVSPPVGFSIGNTNGSVTAISSTSASSGYAGSSGQMNIANAFRTGALNTATGGSGYIQIAFTNNTGNSVYLTSFNFGVRSTSTGPQAYTLRANVDNFTSDIFTGSISNNGTWTYKTNNNLTYTMGTGTTTFRLFGHGGSGNAAPNTANGRFDDVSISFSAVPEPSALLLVGSIIGAGVLRRRRA